MTTQTTSWRPVPSFQRTHHLTRSSRHAIALRSYDHRVEARHVPLTSPVVGAVGEPIRILLVDDPATTVPLEYLLHGLGYWTTRVAPCGRTALKLARDFCPSVVLLSLELPDMSAYRLAAQLRDGTVGRRLRLIALTGDCTYPHRELAREAGFERYLVKPVSVLGLCQLLETSCA